MSTVTLTAQSICGANNHIRLSVAVDADAVRTIVITADDIAVPLTEERIVDTVAALLKIYARGRTRAQVRNALLAGLVITL